jgi:hypothetical protein
MGISEILSAISSGFPVEIRTGNFPRLGLDFENKILMLLTVQIVFKKGEFSGKFQWYNVDS